MDLAQSLDKLSGRLDVLKHDDLIHLLGSLENIIRKTRDALNTNAPPSSPPQDSPLSAHPRLPLPHLQSPSPQSPSPEQSPSPQSPDPPAANEFQHLLRYLPQPLDDDLVARLHQHLKGLKFHPTPSSPNSPEIYLYGERSYIYNKQSSEVSLTPILASLPMAELLIAVNRALNTDYNSMLINKYRNLHCMLGPHKDDEKSLDPASSISALSLGATRRFQVSLNADKNKVTHTVELASRSLCTMLPGFQDSYYHYIAPGRNSVKKEKGVRFSITFRRTLPDAVEVSEKEDEKEEHTPAEKTKQVPVKNINTPDTIVFGSSLTKQLDDTLLSKYKKTFRVFSNSGAKVKDISNDVKWVKENGDLDLQNVSDVFFVCGGNDIENLQKESDIDDVFRDYENLINDAKDAFPVAKINIVSLIPRRARYRAHINNMHEMNEWLEDFCHEHSFRFVNIFSHYILKLSDIWLLNRKLFNNRRLHFNKVGNSVLAKVLIGVANSPR